MGYYSVRKVFKLLYFDIQTNKVHSFFHVLFYSGLCLFSVVFMSPSGLVQVSAYFQWSS